MRTFKYLLFAIVFSIAPESTLFSQTDYYDIHRNAITAKVNSMYGERYDITVDLIDSLLGRNLGRGSVIEDPYGTLAGCTIFEARGLWQENEEYPNGFSCVEGYTLQQRPCGPLYAENHDTPSIDANEIKDPDFGISGLCEELAEPGKDILGRFKPLVPDLVGQYASLNDYIKKKFFLANLEPNGQLSNLYACLDDNNKWKFFIEGAANCIQINTKVVECKNNQNLVWVSTRPAIDAIITDRNTQITRSEDPCCAYIDLKNQIPWPQAVRPHAFIWEPTVVAHEKAHFNDFISHLLLLQNKFQEKFNQIDVSCDQYKFNDDKLIEKGTEEIIEAVYKFYRDDFIPIWKAHVESSNFESNTHLIAHTTDGLELFLATEAWGNICERAKISSAYGSGSYTGRIYNCWDDK